MRKGKRAVVVCVDVDRGFWILGKAAAGSTNKSERRRCGAREKKNNKKKQPTKDKQKPKTKSPKGGKADPLQGATWGAGTPSIDGMEWTVDFGGCWDVGFCIMDGQDWESEVDDPWYHSRLGTGRLSLWVTSTSAVNLSMKQIFVDGFRNASRSPASLFHQGASLDQVSRSGVDSSTSPGVDYAFFFN